MADLCQRAAAVLDVTDADYIAALCDLFGETLGIADVAPFEDFFELGGTSLLGVTLIAQIERRLGKQLRLADLYDNPSAEALARQGQNSRSGTTRLSTVSFAATQGGDAADPVVLVHVVPHDLVRALRGPRPVIALSYGLAAAEPKVGWPPPVGIEALAAHYLTELRQAVPAGPYHLVGASLGGVIAWEMARQLAGSGHEVGLLCLVDTQIPGLPHRRLGLRAFLRNLSAMPPKLLALQALRFGLYRLLQFLGGLSARLAAPELRWEKMGAARRLGLIDHRVDQYRFQPLTARPLLIEATKQLPRLRSQAPLPLGQAIEFLGLSPAGRTVVSLPGHHRSLVKAPLAERVAGSIEAELLRARTCRQSQLP